VFSLTAGKPIIIGFLKAEIHKQIIITRETKDKDTLSSKFV